MPWMKLSDKFHKSGPTERLLNVYDPPEGLAALGLWTVCLSYIGEQCAEGDRSGFIGARRASSLIVDDARPYAARLVAVGLWVEVEGGWAFVDVEQHLPKLRDPAVQAANGRRGAAAREANRQAKSLGNQATSPEIEAKSPDNPGENQAKSPKISSEKSTRATGTGKARTQQPKSTPAREPRSQAEPEQQALIEGGEPKPASAAQRAQALTAGYVELVPLSNFPAVQGIVRKAIAANYTDEQITRGLASLAAEGRPVTTDALRLALEGLPANGRSRHTPYRNPASSAYTEG